MAKYSDNPRENFLIDMMERQKNRTTPITVEDFLKQMGGLSSLGVTAEQLQQKFDQNATGNISNPSMPGSNNLTAEIIKQMQALNIPKRNTNAPAPDVSGPTGGNTKSAVKDGTIVMQDGKKFIAHNNNLYTPAMIVKDKELFHKYSNLVSNKDPGVANLSEVKPQGMQATDTSVISAPGGGKPPVKPTGVNPTTDPNNLPYNNPESNRPILPTSYTGQISLPTDPTEIQLMDYLKKGAPENLLQESTRGGPIREKPDLQFGLR